MIIKTLVDACAVTKPTDNSSGGGKVHPEQRGPGGAADAPRHSSAGSLTLASHSAVLLEPGLGAAQRGLLGLPGLSLLSVAVTKSLNVALVSASCWDPRCRAKQSPRLL